MVLPGLAPRASCLNCRLHRPLGGLSVAHSSAAFRAFDRRPKGAGSGTWLCAASVVAAQFQDPHSFSRTDGSSSAPREKERACIEHRMNFVKEYYSRRMIMLTDFGLTTKDTKITKPHPYLRVLCVLGG